MQRTIQPNTTDDGRLLGATTESLMPQNMRNIIPPMKPTKKSQTEKFRSMLSQMARTNLPLLFEPDGEIILDPSIKPIRLKGINQNKLNALIAALKVGMTKMDAAKIAGICYHTILQWQKKGEQGIFPYFYLNQILEVSQLQMEQEALQNIRDAGLYAYSYIESNIEILTNEHGEQITKEKTMNKQRLPSWQASAWLLERTRDKYRSDRQAIEEEQDLNPIIQQMQSISDIEE